MSKLELKTSNLAQVISKIEQLGYKVSKERGKYYEFYVISNNLGRKLILFESNLVKIGKMVLKKEVIDILLAGESDTFKNISIQGLDIEKKSGKLGSNYSSNLSQEENEYRNDLIEELEALVNHIIKLEDNRILGRGGKELVYELKQLRERRSIIEEHIGILNNTGGKNGNRN